MTQPYRVKNNHTVQHPDVLFPILDNQKIGPLSTLLKYSGQLEDSEFTASIPDMQSAPDPKDPKVDISPQLD